MSYMEKEFVVNEEQTASFLSDAVKRIEQISEADLKALNQIKKLFKKNVPFSRRKYVTAYLVRQALSSGRPRFNRSEGRFGRSEGRFTRGESDFSSRRDFSEREHFSRTREERPERTEHEERPRAPRVQIDPSVSSTIFVGIGRNRRVFPRDLVGLLAGVAGLERERIGEIRVFTNYSFVQLYTEDCDKAISALNGYDFRGRKITVSYSKQKPEEYAEGQLAEKDGGIPQSNGSAYPASERTETEKIADAQTEFAAQQKASSSSDYASQTQSPYSETTDDGQVKSHFGSGEAY